MELLTDPAFVIAGSLAAFIIGMSRGGFAGGIAFVGVLIVAQTISATVAAAFVLPLLCFVDPLGNYVYRKHIHWPSLKILLPGAMVGMLIGGGIFYLVDDTFIKLLVAGLSFYMIADRLINRKRHEKARVLPKPVGFILGIAAGISTFIIHAGYPPVSAYLLPLKLPRMLFIGTFAVLFTTVNYLKLAPYAWLDLLDWSLFWVSAAFFPVCLLGFFFAKWLAPRMSDKMFYQIMYVTVFGLGLKLGVEAVIELLA